MSDKFSAKLREGSDYTFIQIQGVIDEDNHLASLLRQATNRDTVVIIDLGEVTRINSCGVRDWVNWLGEVQQAAREVILIRCSPAIVGQANMVTNFCGDAIIHSFFAPYFIPSSEMSVDKLLYVSQFPAQGAVRAPSFVSEETDEPMEFDDFEESYFAFLDGLDRARLNARVQDLVQRASPDLEMKIRQLNEGDLSQLTGPVNTATLATPPREHAAGLDKLISSASDARRAGEGLSAGTQPTPLRPAPQRPDPEPPRPAPPEPVAPPPVAPPPIGGHQPPPTVPRPPVTGSPGGGSATLIYGLIAAAVVVVIILIVLVFTLTPA